MSRKPSDEYDDHDPYNWKSVPLTDSPFFTTRPDGDAAAVIAGAIAHGMESVAIVGVDFSGQLYLASTTTAAEMIILLSETVARLLTGRVDAPLDPSRTPCPPKRKPVQ